MSVLVKHQSIMSFSHQFTLSFQLINNKIHCLYCLYTSLKHNKKSPFMSFLALNILSLKLQEKCALTVYYSLVGYVSFIPYTANVCGDNSTSKNKKPS